MIRLSWNCRAADVRVTVGEKKKFMEGVRIGNRLVQMKDEYLDVQTTEKNDTKAMEKIVAWDITVQKHMANKWVGTYDPSVYLLCGRCRKYRKSDCRSCVRSKVRKIQG